MRSPDYDVARVAAADVGRGRGNGGQSGGRPPSHHPHHASTATAMRLPLVAFVPHALSLVAGVALNEKRQAAPPWWPWPQLPLVQLFLGDSRGGGASTHHTH
ncbi:hypothetical protein DQ04_06681000 [Trypanosoma grayi]|uniref:hypothetical protein n=1 Tax=Trypanosoma grayi TaxID=71804 RepID=UPI0004F48478|nr:hypothetical protein DQ04_06681000 [Trypanosoma grayi]KEG08662.1 hypothetical protein DQ04_06681000 [Trypanosoma grayi]